MHGFASVRSTDIWGGAVPYNSNSDLPAPVQGHLPAHAQDIPSIMPMRRTSGDSRREEVAHRIGWAAVKRSYIKFGEAWVVRE
ncbi:ChaB family protein [Paraburkholderia sp. RL17-373-BIF-A]